MLRNVNSHWDEVLKARAPSCSTPVFGLIRPALAPSLVAIDDPLLIWADRTSLSIFFVYCCEAGTAIV